MTNACIRANAWRRPWAALFALSLLLLASGWAQAASSVAAVSLTLTAAPASPQQVNTPITLTAALTGWTTSVQYKFLAGLVKSTAQIQWTVLSDFSATSSCVWTPTAGGAYLVEVVARQVNNTFTASRVMQYTVKQNTQPTSVSLTVAPASPQETGTPITLTAAAQGGQNVAYRFTVARYVADRSDPTWTVAAPYGSSSTCSWTPKTADWFLLRVQARNAGTNPANPVYSIVKFHVTSPVKVTISPKSIWVLVGQQQSFIAQVTGAANTAVNWSVLEGNGGTIDTGGTYTAPYAFGTFHVVATSVANANRSATAEVHTYDGLNRLKELAWHAVSERYPIIHGGIDIIYDTIPGWNNPFFFGEVGAKAFPKGVVNITADGLLFSGNWTTSSNPLDVNGLVDITGTTSDADADNGTQMNLALTGAVTNGAGTVNLTGTMIPPGGTTYNVSIDKTVDCTSSIGTVHIVANETQSGSQAFGKDITLAVDALSKAPQPRTANGTLNVYNPTDLESSATATLTDLVYTYSLTTANVELVTYQSGTLALKDNLGNTATLTAQPNGTLAGTVLNSLGQAIATMTVNQQLQVTVVRD